MIRIGPAGNSRAFYKTGRKHTYQAPEWLDSIGLNAFEYSFGRGVRMRPQTAEAIRVEMQKYDIAISAHSPYYINFCGAEEGAKKSYKYLEQSLRACVQMGGNRVVVHTGTEGSDRKRALGLAAERLCWADEKLQQQGFADYFICLETMGKYTRIGNHDEILELCKLSPRFLPCFDFGHINALMQGGLKTSDDYKRIIDMSFDRLGEYKTKNAHVHFSKLEYSKKGEVRHLDFTDKKYGPEFEPFARVIVDYKLTPVIICESNENMSDDALTMKCILEKM